MGGPYGTDSPTYYSDVNGPGQSSINLIVPRSQGAAVGGGLHSLL